MSNVLMDAFTIRTVRPDCTHVMRPPEFDFCDDDADDKGVEDEYPYFSKSSDFLDDEDEEEEE